MGMHGSVWERWKNQLKDSVLWEDVGEVITFKAIGAKPSFLMYTEDKVNNPLKGRIPKKVG